MANAEESKTELQKLLEQIAAQKVQNAADEANDAADESLAIEKAKLDLEELQQQAAAREVISNTKKKLGPRGRKWDYFMSELGIVVVRRPVRTRYNEWLKSENQTDPDAMMAFASTCIEYPTLQKFDEIVTNQPAKLVTATAIANRLGGANAKELEGK